MIQQKRGQVSFITDFFLAEAIHGVRLNVRTKKCTLERIGTQPKLVMTGITATEARSNLYRLIDETAESHQPIVITGKRNNTVLVSEEDWSAIQETLYLLSVPGMRESIRKVMDTAVGECNEELGW